MSKWGGCAALVASVPLHLPAASIASLYLEDQAGRRVEVSTAAAPATVLLFSSTVCPVANDYVERMEALFDDFQSRGVRLLVVYSNRTESRPDIERHAREGRFRFPVYRDPGNAAADAVEARLTPEAVVLDRTGARVWRGPIDDHVNPARVQRRLLRDAVTALLDGRRPEPSPVQPYG